MKTQQIAINIFSFLCLVTLTACGTSEDQVAATMAVQTIEARATGTAEIEQAVSAALTNVAPTLPPTSTATAMQTPMQSPTVAITLTPTTDPGTSDIVPPTILSNYMENVYVTSLESFDPGSGWEFFNPSGITGVLEISGSSENAIVNITDRAFGAGEGIIVNFKIQNGAEGNIHFSGGEGDTPSFRMFGIGIEENNTQIFQSKSNKYQRLEPQYKYINIKTDQWYSMLLAIGFDGDFLCFVWDPSTPDKFISRDQKIEEWKDLSWKIWVIVDRGTILFDDFMEIQFDNFLQPSQ